MEPLALVVFIVVVALLFDFINGFHDAANSIATVGGTLASLLGAFLGGKIADTIGSHSVLWLSTVAWLCASLIAGRIRSDLAPLVLPEAPELLRHAVRRIWTETWDGARTMGRTPHAIWPITSITVDQVGQGIILTLALVVFREELGEDHVVISDLCLDEYTDHGHCGVMDAEGNVDNDRTVELYQRIALAQAEAGAHMVGPSGMMDGQVRAIREALDGNGFERVGIMAYAAKFASAFYGPFREAAESTPAFGDRRGYQMDPPNQREALREMQLDLEEGADILMVKPALPYLDVIRRAKDATAFPMAAYNVSGEYAMVKAAALNGWLDERRTVLEILTSIRRAGADLILTYHAKDAADWLRNG